jgi:hypothetical protein
VSTLPVVNNHLLLPGQTRLCEPSGKHFTVWQRVAASARSLWMCLVAQVPIKVGIYGTRDTGLLELLLPGFRVGKIEAAIKNQRWFGVASLHAFV